MAARSGAADILPRPASSRKKPKPGATDTNPSSTPSEDAQAKTEEKGGVRQLFSVQGQNQVSLRSEEVKTEETLTKIESKPDFNHVQQRAVITEKMPTSDLKTFHSNSDKTPAFFKISHVKSVSSSERKVTTDDTNVIQQISNLESNSRSEGEPGQHLESNSGSKAEEKLNLRTEFDSVSKDENKSQGSSKTSDLQLNPGRSRLRGEMRLDVGESRRKEEKRPESEEKRKEVNNDGGKKPSLR